ncbi:ATP-binding protein [Streptomyces sp. NBC_01613]|uniref:ATP-binding protein n=1 Tax=Streptomyces sp. NBC_01613 TaxID=2975896 RepID=UPI0038667CB5
MSLSAHPAPRFGPTALPVERAGRGPRRTAPRTASLRLSGTGRGCAQAREFTDRTLGHWELDQCRDDALTVISELAANAMLHARLCDATDDDEAVSEVWVKLTLRSAHLVCAVTDQSDSLPRCPDKVGPLQEHGRGLLIVEALSQHWGWTRYTPRGKTVWAMLPTGLSAEACT